MTHRVNSGEAALLSQASPLAKKAYRRLKNPPEYELYDLQADPFEFNNLAEDPSHAKQLMELVQQLTAWQKRTADALADPDKARELFDMVRDAKLDRNRRIPYVEFMNTFLPNKHE